MNNILKMTILTTMVLSLLVLILLIFFHVGTYENKDKHHYMYYVNEKISEDVLKVEVLDIKYNIFNESEVSLTVDVILSVSPDTVQVKRYYVFIIWENNWEDNSFIEKMKYNLTSIKQHDRPFSRDKLRDIDLWEIKYE